MRHVLRDSSGKIVSLHLHPVEGSEALPPSHPTCRRFWSLDEAQTFAAMDAGLVRVLEDLIDVLIQRNILRVTDLPLKRKPNCSIAKHFREGMQAHSLKLFGDQLPSGLDQQASDEAMGKL